MQIGSKSILTQAIFFELPGILQVSDSLVQLQMKKVQLFAFGARYRNFNILFKFNSSELLLDIQYRRKIKKCTFLQNDSRLKLIFLQPEQFLLIRNKEVCDKFKIRLWKIQLAGIPDLNFITSHKCYHLRVVLLFPREKQSKGVPVEILQVTLLDGILWQKVSDPVI